MQCVRVEANRAERLPAALVFALEIFLGHDLAGLQNEQAVDVLVLARANVVGESSERRVRRVGRRNGTCQQYCCQKAQSSSHTASPRHFSLDSREAGGV